MRAEELSPAEAERIVEVLAPFVSDARKGRIEEVLAGRTDAVTVVLENIYGAHNAAAVLRTAEALGLLEVHVIAESVDFRVSRKVSQGAHKWLNVLSYRDAREAYAGLRARGVSIFAADVRPGALEVGSIPVDRPVALVFGNEHEGLSSSALEAADDRFTVPMRGFVESLNVSVACAVSLYEVLERSRSEGRAHGLSAGIRARLRAAWYAASVRAGPELLARAGLPTPVPCRESVTLDDDAR